MANARKRARVAFEFIEKLGAPFYAFHDRDVAPEGGNLAQTNKNLDAVVDVLEEEQARTGIKRALGNRLPVRPSPLRARGRHQLQRGGFRLRGRPGEKGLGSDPPPGWRRLRFLGRARGILDPPQHQSQAGAARRNLARFLHMAVDYKKAIGFKGQFYIEPKPKEPTKHQYDSDAAACLNFLREFGLKDHLKLNLETNHATLAEPLHAAHEPEVAAAARTP